MKNGTCPKCQSTEVYSDINEISYGHRCKMAGPKGKFSTQMFINVYACLSCGYFEEYIKPDVLRDEKRMDKVKEGWQKVG